MSKQASSSRRRSGAKRVKAAAPPALQFRALTPADLQLELDFLLGLSSESLYQRVMGTVRLRSIDRVMDLLTYEAGPSMVLGAIAPVVPPRRGRRNARVGSEPVAMDSMARDPIPAGPTTAGSTTAGLTTAGPTTSGPAAIDPAIFQSIIALQSGAASSGAVTSRLLGVARYAPTEHAGIAEMAIVIADDQHGRGLARALLERLHEIAAGHGYREMTALTFSNNQPMLGLATRLGYQRVVEAGDGGVVRLNKSLIPDDAGGETGEPAAGNQGAAGGAASNRRTASDTPRISIAMPMPVPTAGQLPRSR